MRISFQELEEQGFKPCDEFFLFIVLVRSEQAVFGEYGVKDFMEQSAPHIVFIFLYVYAYGSFFKDDEAVIGARDEVYRVAQNAEVHEIWSFRVH